MANQFSPFYGKLFTCSHRFHIINGLFWIYTARLFQYSIYYDTIRCMVDNFIAKLILKCGSQELNGITHALWFDSERSCMHIAILIYWSGKSAGSLIFFSRLSFCKCWIYMRVAWDQPRPGQFQTNSFSVNSSSPRFLAQRLFIPTVQGLLCWKAEIDSPIL